MANVINRGPEGHRRVDPEKLESHPEIGELLHPKEPCHFVVILLILKETTHSDFLLQNLLHMMNIYLHTEMPPHDLVV